jgi:hypothetical protein
MVDEICQIGGYYCPLATANSSTATATATFSQYVMPHRNPNPGARQGFFTFLKA